MLEMTEDDENVLDLRLLQMANIDKNGYKARHKISPQTPNEDVDLNFKSNAALLERLNVKIGADGDQMTLQLFLLKISLIQRASKHSMVVSQIEHRLEQMFKEKSTMFTEVMNVVCKIAGESNVQKKMFHDLQAFLSRKHKIKTNAITEAERSNDSKQFVEMHSLTHLLTLD